MEGRFLIIKSGADIVLRINSLVKTSPWLLAHKAISFGAFIVANGS
ncbi:MAG: hypothetical protein V4556_02760 [Bacteroidota bacterium]